MPSECPLPAPMVDQLVVVGPDTKTGDDLLLTVVSPTCPELLAPHPYNLPVVVIAKECVLPAVTDAHENSWPPGVSKTGLLTLLELKLPT